MGTTDRNNVSSDFRADIGGLRAIAVLSVLLFHFKFKGFEGGFVGVDIFFVISGYLITRQILERSAKGNFSFIEFYTRRMSRILPALIFTVLLTFIFGVLWLPPEFLRGLAKESTHALLSISNIQYWREANEYFAPRSEQLGLLHFWSLSLEEQFYLLWPALIVISMRFVQPVTAIAFASGGSFIAAMLWSMRDPQAVFFLMPFRIFEFGIGALVIFSEKRFVLGRAGSDILFVVGFAAIAFSVLYFDPQWPYLGCAVIVPSLGAAAIIQAQVSSHASSRLAPLLTNRLFVGIGTISYSLYLCHWPILFFARFIFGEAADSLSGTMASLTATFIVGGAMYRFVEQPSRQGRSAPAKGYGRVVGAYLGSIAAFAVVTHTAFMQQGWSWRLSKDQAEIAELQSFGMRPCALFEKRRCAFGEIDQPVGVELVGDSYIQQYVAALDPILKQLQLRGETSTVGGCPILSGIKSKGPRSAECAATRDNILSSLEKTTTPIVFGLAWQGYSDELIASENNRLTQSPSDSRLTLLQQGLEDTVRQIGKNGRRIMLVGAQVVNKCKIDRARLLPGPLWHSPMSECAATLRETALQEGAAVSTMLRAIQAKWPEQITLLLPVDYLCDQTCAITSNGLWLYQDEGHFTVAGSRFMGTRARTVLMNFLSPSR